MKIIIKNASFGFEKGGVYEADEYPQGYFAKNAHVGRLIPKADAEIYEEDSHEYII